LNVRRLDDPAAFLDAANDMLLADEARHNLILGIAGTLRDHPGVYRKHALWLVEEHGPVLAALQTPPYNVILSRPLVDDATGTLARALADEDVALPGVTAALPEVEQFAKEWARLNGIACRQQMRQRIYRLTDLRPVQGVPGRPRRASPRDRGLLVDWVAAFAEESLPPDSPGRASRATVDARLDEGTGGFLIWEDNGPVSIAGWGGETPNGVRIGPVYTPHVHRRRGYGSAVTAAVSADRFRAGRSFCFLYTDLANPTSNRIYIDIGYEPVCDSVDYAFERQ
jgi:GNAT superfamily N-acetyltransferase